jgi:hypothetical protein
MRKLTAIVLMLTSALVLAADAQRVEHEFQGIRLGGLLKGERSMGCSCSFLYVPDIDSRGSALLEWGLARDGAPETAVMYVDGQLEKLKVPTGFPPRARRGDRVTCKLAGPRVQVELSLETTAVCDGTRECDGIGYSGTMQVVRGSVIASVPITGGCSC